MIKYIYKITNSNNSKVYIGQTVSPELRWYYHINYLSSKQKLNNPLYIDMRKYGVDTFKMEAIETINETDPQETIDRETHWINYYDSLNNGYNRVLGGVGGSVKKFDHEEIAAALKTGINHSEVAKQFGCSITTVLKIRDKYGIPAYKPSEPPPKLIKQPTKETPRKVNMLDKDGFLENTYESVEAAAKKFYKTKLSIRKASLKIMEACENDTFAYDHKWEYSTK